MGGKGKGISHFLHYEACQFITIVKDSWHTWSLLGTNSSCPNHYVGSYMYEAASVSLSCDMMLFCCCCCVLGGGEVAVCHFKNGTYFSLIVALLVIIWLL